MFKAIFNFEINKQNKGVFIFFPNAFLFLIFDFLFIITKRQLGKYSIYNFERKLVIRFRHFYFIHRIIIVFLLYFVISNIYPSNFIYLWKHLIFLYILLLLFRHTAN